MNLDEIRQTITPVLKKYNVIRAGVFGSYAKNTAGQKSDLDLLVELTYPMSLLTFAGLKIELEDLLGKPVDLVEYKSIKPIIRKNILEKRSANLWLTEDQHCFICRIF